jgi:hypothetical protein
VPAPILFRLRPDYPRKRRVSRWCHNAGLEPVSIHGSVMHYLLTFKK